MPWLLDFSLSCTTPSSLVFDYHNALPLLTMPKSKTKALIFKTTQGDFSLHCPRHGSASRAARALSRNHSPVQQVTSSRFSPPRRKVVLVDFVTPSSGVRVSEKQKGKSMQRNSSSHCTTAPNACNDGYLRPHTASNERLAGSNPSSPHPSSGHLTRGSSQSFSG